MSSNIVNQQPFIRSTWDFPKDGPSMSVEMNRSYLELAQFVNARTIGLFPTNRPAQGGEQWFIPPDQNQPLASQRVYNFRQVYTVGAIAAATPTTTIPHGIDIFQNVSFMTKCQGALQTVSNNWIGCIFASGNAIAGQYTFFVGRNSAPGVLDGNITILQGAAAQPINKGIIVLEWINNL